MQVSIAPVLISVFFNFILENMEKYYQGFSLELTLL